MRTLLLEEMTWPEIREALDNGMRTVIIFAASIEQHGPHLAEVTDTVLGYAEALDLAKRLGNALVAPVIRPGLSPHHMPLPGSLTLRPEIFIGIVEDYISSYVHHGFDTVILCSSHGGNFKAMEQVAESESKKYPSVKIISGCDLDATMDAFEQAEKEAGLAPGACGGHSCAWETSVMLKIAPEHVRMDKAEPGFMKKDSQDVLNEFFTKGVVAVSKNGVMGDPTPSTSEMGERFFTAFQDIQEKIVKDKLTSL